MVRRFLLYFMGFSMGAILVYFTMIKDRDEDIFAYLPNDRVTKKIRVKLNYSDDFVQCKIACQKIDTTEFKTMMREAEVDFDKSKPRNNPAEYTITMESTHKTLYTLKAVYYQKGDYSAIRSFSSTNIPDCKC